MSAVSIPVDLFNPGQVFASLGFMEAALQLGQPVRGGFDWSTGETRFVLAASEDPFDLVLRHLAICKVVAVQQPGDPFPADKWGVPAQEGDLRSEVPRQASIATVMALLQGPLGELRLDHWGDGTRRDKVKFWAGSGGMPGATFAQRILDALRSGSHAGDWRARPFDVQVPLSSSLRFDPRGSGVPMDAGFSENSLRHVRRAGFPLVELLAALGLGSARPLRPDPRDKLVYRYAVLAAARQRAHLHHPALLRAALGCVDLPYPTRRFTMRLDWPGKEGQARCITTVQETTS